MLFPMSLVGEAEKKWDSVWRILELDQDEIAGDPVDGLEEKYWVGTRELAHRDQYEVM